MTPGMIVPTSISRAAAAERRALRLGAVTSVEICELCVVSYRQVDYWTRAGYLQTIGKNEPGSGRHRVYAKAELRVARALRVLVALQGSPHRSFDLFPILARIRAGGGGYLEPVPGVMLDLDVLCQ